MYMCELISLSCPHCRFRSQSALWKYMRCAIQQECMRQESNTAVTLESAWFSIAMYHYVCIHTQWQTQGNNIQKTTYPDDSYPVQSKPWHGMISV